MKRQRQKQVKKRTKQRRKWMSILLQFLPKDLVNFVSEYVPPPFLYKIRAHWKVDVGSFGKIYFLNDHVVVSGMLEDELCIYDLYGSPVLIPGLRRPSYSRYVIHEEHFLVLLCDAIREFAFSGEITNEWSFPSLDGEDRSKRSTVRVLHPHLAVSMLWEDIDFSTRSLLLFDFRKGQLLKKIALGGPLWSVTDFEMYHVYVYAGENAKGGGELVIGYWDLEKGEGWEIQTGVMAAPKRIIHLRDDKVFVILKGSNVLMEFCLRSFKCKSTCWKFNTIATNGSHLAGLWNNSLFIID